jgi:hypothetical protein
LLAKSVFVLSKTADLGRANESEIEGVEKQANPFSLKLFETDFAKLACLIGLSFEIGSRGTNF